MRFQKKIFISCFLLGIILTGSSLTVVRTDSIKKWVISKECTVKVNGSTNVNKFSCTVPYNPGSDTLTCLLKNNNGPVTMRGKLALPVSGFDCVNPMMTKDLRKTLRSKEFPVFYIYFLSMEKYPSLRSAQESITGMVNIELAGVKKLLEVNFKISMDDQKIVHLAGAKTIYFSDFNIIPPRKLGGMIQANDKLDVEFYINFTVSP